MKTLLRLMLLLMIVVAAAAFFFGYRIAVPDRQGVPSETSPRDPADTTRAREVGAEVGERIAAGADAAQRAVSNGQITAKIKSKMALDDLIRAATIDIDTAEGVVTLTGAVRSQAERERAVRLARETEGVSSVVDRLTIQ